MEESLNKIGMKTINSSTLKNGVYHLRIEGKDFVQIEKVVILPELARTTMVSHWTISSNIASVSFPKRH